MEHMDIDSIVYVPDTPDRLAARETKFKSSIEVPDSPDTKVVGDKVNSCNDKDSIGMRANENGIRKHCMGPPRRHHGSSSAAAPGNSSSKISSVTKRHDPSHESSHNQSSKSEKIRNGISYVPREGAVEGPTEQHCHGNKGKKVVSLGGIQIIENGKRMLSDKGKKAVLSGSSQIVENGKNFISATQLHSQQSVADSRLVSRISNGTGNNSTVSAFDRGKGVESNAVTQPKVGQFVSASFSSPRNTGQKRLVRNGCISPCNVAKAQKDLGKGKNGTIDEGPSHVSSSRTQAGVHSKAQASNVSNKGKGIIPLSNDESGGQNTNDRDTVSINEILEEDDDDRIRGILSGGWRATHNRSKKTHPSSSEERQLLPADSPLPLRQRLRPVDTLTSSSDDSPLPLRQRLRPVSQSNQHDRDHPVTDMNRKRQKQGSSSSTQDVRSQNTSDDSGIVFLGSSGDNTTESRPTRTRRRNNVARAIELDGASSSNSVDPAMTRQMEADEILARELQEQLYNEELGLRFGEIDVHERLDLLHENVLPDPPRRTRQASTARTVSTGIPSRLPRARTNMNGSRTLHETRAMLQNRMRSRYRFPGRPRTVSSSSREVSTLFPSEMDVELRMTILEALEEFNDMGVDSSLLQIHREFNENDYEMLLGLDENNHRHSGASNRRINELPQTTLENDLEEACAVCLETPTTGDTIRHLPCFHKFHKDCIDPWLTRKSSCPVCKHSIT